MSVALEPTLTVGVWVLKLDSASIATLRLAVVNSNLYSLFLAVLLNTAGLYRLFALSLRMGRSRTLVAGNVLSMSLKSLHWLDWYIGGNVAQSWLQQVELHSIETAKVGDVLGCTLFQAASRPASTYCTADLADRRTPVIGGRLFSAAGGSLADADPHSHPGEPQCERGRVWRVW